MAFNVLFRGLVCHLTKEKMSVFVGAPEHELRLVVKTKDLVGVSGFERDGVHTRRDPDDPEQDTAERTSIVIGGKRLRIEGVTNRELTQKRDFADRVPSLRKGGARGAVRAAVRQRRLADGIAGFFEYPGGVFSVKRFFPEQAIFDSSTPACIAHTVRLSFGTNGGNVTIRNGTRKVTIKPNAEVEFVNGPEGDEQEGGLPNQHFHHYYHAIFTGHEAGVTPTPASDLKCTGKPGPVFAGLDCSNSQEP